MATLTPNINIILPIINNKLYTGITSALPAHRPICRPDLQHHIAPI